ncbi:Centrosomal protein of 131 kDa [Lobulomyces angularis]|nr:Centrosomal protein of 131 kDa [Lobulomyces angularis]
MKKTSVSFLVTNSTSTKTESKNSKLNTTRKGTGNIPIKAKNKIPQSNKKFKSFSISKQGPSVNNNKILREVGSDFLSILDSNAKKIQVWYRNIILKRKNLISSVIQQQTSNMKIGEVSNWKKLRQKFQPCTEVNSTLTNKDIVKKRREDSAKRVKDELLKEFLRHKSENSSMETLIELQEDQSENYLDFTDLCKEKSQPKHEEFSNDNVQQVYNWVLGKNESFSNVKHNLNSNLQQDINKREWKNSELADKDCIIQGSDGNAEIELTTLELNGSKNFFEEVCFDNLQESHTLQSHYSTTKIKKSDYDIPLGNALSGTSTINEWEDSLNSINENSYHNTVTRKPGGDSLPPGCKNIPSPRYSQINFTEIPCKEDKVAHVDSIIGEKLSDTESVQSIRAQNAKEINSDIRFKPEATKKLTTMQAEGKFCFESNKPVINEYTSNKSLKNLKVRSRTCTSDSTKTSSTISNKVSADSTWENRSKTNVNSCVKSRSRTDTKNESVSSYSTESKEENLEADSNYSQSLIQEEQTNERIERILGFLKNVEDDDQKKKSKLVIEKNATSINADAFTEPYKASSFGTAAVFDGVKAKIIGQQLELEEKTQTILAFKTEIKRLKEENKENANQYKKDLKSKTSLQKKEYETIIKRHLGFIDKLLLEKDDLGKKCENLTEEVKQIEKGFKEKCKSIEEQHLKEIKQQKELWQATEKVKRDKWISEKTKLIKDQTVKGLEPEIQRMLAHHKLQLRQLEEKLRDEFSKEKDLLIDQHQRQLANVRDRIVGERQKACEEEREFARQRYQKQLERDEMEFQQQKRKLLSEFNEQKQISSEIAKEERRTEESRLKNIVEGLRNELAELRLENDKNSENMRKRHQDELHALQEKLMAQKEDWQKQYMEKQEGEIRCREKTFKEKLLKERDSEIEMIIQRLESESGSGNSEVERRHRLELEKLRQEQSEELKELRDSHRQALDKILKTKNELKTCEERNMELEKEVLILQHSKQAKENTIKKQKDSLDRLQVDETALSDLIRTEFESELEKKEQLNKNLQQEIDNFKNQLDILQRKHQNEMIEITKQKESTFSIVEEQVKKTVAGKEEIINSLRLQIDEMLIKNNHLEKMIEKQRRELLS